jgi:hypothetical protein
MRRLGETVVDGLADKCADADGTYGDGDDDNVGDDMPLVEAATVTENDVVPLSDATGDGEGDGDAEALPLTDPKLGEVTADAETLPLEDELGKARVGDAIAVNECVAVGDDDGSCGVDVGATAVGLTLADAPL